MPATSRPGVIGSAGSGNGPPRRPARMNVSIRCTPAAATSMRTWPGPGSRVGHLLVAQRLRRPELVLPDRLHRVLRRSLHRRPTVGVEADVEVNAARRPSCAGIRSALGGGRASDPGVAWTCRAPMDLPRTLGELRASGHRLRGVKDEIRDNLLAALRAGPDPWPGIVGFESTVLPQLERALIAGHDVVLLGERGQGKTRLLRSLANLLDEWTPVIDGSELGEHPYEPITPAVPAARRRARRRRCRSPGATATSATPRSWPPRTPRSPT